MRPQLDLHGILKAGRIKVIGLSPITVYLMSEKAPRQFYVYVIELKSTVRDEKKFMEANPHYTGKKKCFYVGQSSVPPHVRYEQHINGYKAARFVKRYAKQPVVKGLRYDLFEKYNPMDSRQEASRRERKLANNLKHRGFGVWWN